MRRLSDNVVVPPGLYVTVQNEKQNSEIETRLVTCSLGKGAENPSGRVNHSRAGNYKLCG